MPLKYSISIKQLSVCDVHFIAISSLPGQEFHMKQMSEYLNKLKNMVNKFFINGYNIQSYLVVEDRSIVLPRDEPHLVI